MGRYRYTAYVNDHMPRYIVVWSMHWALIECQRLEPDVDLSASMTATIERLATEGWVAEAIPEFGFTFIRSPTERRLLSITPRDPHNETSQSFSPFT